MKTSCFITTGYGPSSRIHFVVSSRFSIYDTDWSALFFTPTVERVAIPHIFTMSDSAKPSTEALKDNAYKSVVIGNINFATDEEVKVSVRESSRKTEVWTLSERLSYVEKIALIPVLSSSNWTHWYESIQRLMRLSDTSAAFINHSPSNKATTLWFSWWATKLRETAPHIRTAPRDSPLTILTKKVNMS